MKSNIDLPGVELIPIFETVEGIDKLLTVGTIGRSEFDVYVPLMSLPYILGTNLDTIPSQVLYLKISRKSKLKIQNLISKTQKELQNSGLN